MEQVAGHLGCEPGEVIVSSTGVIGVPLPKDKARDGVEAALTAPPCSWEAAAETIGTTDTFPKGSAASAIVGRSEEHTSELQSLMRISYAVFCLKKKNKT